MKLWEADQLFEKYQKSSGYKKFQNYIREIFESDHFQIFVKNIRDKYKIPESGFQFTPEERWIPPREWVFTHNTEVSGAFENEIKEFCAKYKIHFIDGIDIFENYIFYNSKDYSMDIGGFSVCIVSDIANEKVDPYAKDIQDADDASYPIAIRISPYASLRDILDFVKVSYKFPIKHLQEKYKDKAIKLGKFKKRKTVIQKRNEFIYQNRHLPRRQIARLVLEKFGSKNDIDYGYIGKIISLERKKRKEL